MGCLVRRTFLLIIAACCLSAASGGPLPQGFHISIAPLSAHFFTRLADVFRFVSQLDCRKDGGANQRLPLHSEPVSNRLPLYFEFVARPVIPGPIARLLSASPTSPPSLLNPPPHPPPASGVLCNAADRGSILSTFLGDDFASSSIDVNSMTAEQLLQPLEIDATCYGVATATFDIA